MLSWSCTPLNLSFIGCVTLQVNFYYCLTITNVLDIRIALNNLFLKMLNSMLFLFTYN